MKRLKWLAYIPVIIWMIVIFWFSGNNSEESATQSGRVSFGIVDVVERIFHLDIPDGRKAQILDSIGKIVRKAAHFGEYMILAALAWIALYCTCPFVREQERGRAGYTAVLIFTALYAASDEIHQYFVPGRHGSGLDVALDTAGGAAACLLIIAIRRLRGNGRKQKSV